MRLVIGYVRVSTIEQEQGFGREAQEAKIRKYCTEQGLSEPEIIQESKSGESILERQELKMIMARTKSVVEDGGEAHVVFAVLDRLSRHLIDQESLYQQALSFGVRLHSTNPSENDTLDPAQSDDPARTLIRQVFGVLNQFERSVIRQRLDSGKEQKADLGGWCGGRVPYGYKSENRELVVVPEEAAVIQLAFSIYKRGFTQREVAAIVSVRTGQNWTYNRLAKILKNEDRYRGNVYIHYQGRKCYKPELNILDKPAGTFGEVKERPKDKALSHLLEVEPWKYGEQISIKALAYIIGYPENVCMGVAVRHGVELKYNKAKALYMIESKRLEEYYRAFTKTLEEGTPHIQLEETASSHMTPKIMYRYIENQLNIQGKDHITVDDVNIGTIPNEGLLMGIRSTPVVENVAGEVRSEKEQDEDASSLDQDISSLDKDLDL